MKIAFSMLGVVALLCVTADAALTYNAQSRSVTASSENFEFGSLKQTISAPDFSAFDATAHVDYPAGSGTKGSAYSTQSQKSTLEPSKITISGGASGKPMKSAGTGSTYSTSLTDVQFTLDRLSTIVIQSSITGNDPVLKTATRDVKVTGSGVNIALQLHNYPVTGSAFYSGIIEPGQYRLFVQIDTSIADNSGDQTASTFDVQLSFSDRPVPEPGGAAVMGTIGGGFLAVRRRRMRKSKS